MTGNKLKSILFFPINGSGLGHLNRCLAYARRLPQTWRISFFSLSPAIGAVEEMGFEADYFLSPFWTVNSSTNWNRELCMRLALMLEEIEPDILLFDGTFPYLGLRRALEAYKKPLKLIWSRRGLFKARKIELKDFTKIFDLIIQPGELDALENQENLLPFTIPNFITPPVTLFNREELLPAREARECLNLSPHKKYILISIGPGNLKDISTPSQIIMKEIISAGYTPVWLQSPIAQKVLEVPDGVELLEAYPVSRYLKAFDGLISAAGYNSCYEAAMSGLPTFFVPNEKLQDNQEKRADLLVKHNLGLLCKSIDEKDLEKKLHDFFRLIELSERREIPFPNGAAIAADIITGMV